MESVADEERHEAELARWYFGRARNRVFEGLEADGAHRAAQRAKAAKKTKHIAKQAPKVGASEVALPDESIWQGSFFFLQLADTQFGFYNENLSWDKEIALATRAVRCINAMRPRPRFVVVRDFKRVMQKINPSIPLVCLCGNHDVGNTPTRATIFSYKERFGDDYFRFWVGGVCCLVLNASLFHDPSMALEDYEEQQVWFVNELQTFSKERERTKAKHLLVFQHQPWFLEEADEEDQYFNIPKERRMPMLEEMTKAGVRAVFAGHYHRNAYGTLGPMEMITTSAVGRPLGIDPSGFRVVKVNEDGIEHAYYSLDSLEKSDTSRFDGAVNFCGESS